MYFIERSMRKYWDTKEGQRILKNPKRKDEELDLALVRETGRDSKGEKCWHPLESASDTPHAPVSLYEQNDRFLDFRTPFDERRGLITMVAAVFAPTFVIAVKLLVMMILDIFPKYGVLFTVLNLACSIIALALMAKYFNKHGFLKSIFFGLKSMVAAVIAMVLVLIIAEISNSELFDKLHFSIVFFIGIMGCYIMIGGYLFIAQKLFRLEIFVQRRLLVRFDRLNRKVHLHRPSYAGGIVSLDWDNVEVELDIKKSRFGVPLPLSWHQSRTSDGLPECALVGRNSRSHDELAQRWEFIRRFMEDGPQAVPREKRLTKFPWPWNSVIAAGSLVWPFIMMMGKDEEIPPQVIVGGILISPAILLYAAFHWLSLLLCWEPVFPREIRKACGESFLPVIKARLVDLVAWAMLGGLIWWNWSGVLYLLRIGES